MSYKLNRYSKNNIFYEDVSFAMELVSASTGDKKIVTGKASIKIKIEDRSRECFVFIENKEEKIYYEAHGFDYIDTFNKIRLELEKQKKLPVCYGASRKFYSPGLLRDTAWGLDGYYYDSNLNSDDAYKIFFDTGEDVEPCTVEEQHQYIHEYIKNQNTE